MTEGCGYAQILADVINWAAEGDQQTGFITPIIVGSITAVTDTGREEAARLGGQLAATQAQSIEILARLAPVASVAGEPAASDTQPKAQHT